MNCIFNPSLGLYLPLYELDGSSFMSKDAYGHLCTVTGASWRPTGLYFDGSDDLINIDNVLATVLSGNTQGTFILWIKPVDSTPAAEERFLFFGDTDANEILGMAMNTDSKLRVHCNVGGVAKWRAITSGAAFTSNKWSFAGITHNGVEAKVFLDGEIPPQTFDISVDKTVWFSGATGLDNGRIGCQNSNTNGNTNHLNGQIGGVWIFSRALTHQEIHHIYLATKWRYK
ncbi:MAG: LamG domain-containing protein [Dehalococcoidales bacterium]|nr:LamG domain-containing protein [Dehalococcoidales bacterium]